LFLLLVEGLFFRDAMAHSLLFSNDGIGTPSSKTYSPDMLNSKIQEATK